MPRIQIRQRESIMVDRLFLGHSVQGQTWYVDSVNGNAANHGHDPKAAFATITQAIAAAAADSGDVIVILDKYTEDIPTAGGLDFSKDGIKFVGLGNGDNRPILTVSTLVGASIDVTGNNVLLENIVFRTTRDSLTVLLDVLARQLKMVDCEIQENASAQILVGINVGTVDNDADGFECYNLKATQVTTGGDSMIKLTKVQDRVIIEDCDIDGDFADAGIHNPTSAICTNLAIDHNKVRNRNSGNHAIEIVSASLGHAYDNLLMADAGATIFDPGALFVAGNRYSTGVDQESKTIIPVMPTQARPADGTSLEEIVRQIHDETALQLEVIGEMDIDISGPDYTSFQNILTIVPAADSPIRDLVVHLDLVKTTTGFVAVHNTETIQFSIARKVDGTNWVRDVDTETATRAANLSGLEGLSITIGSVGVDEQVRLEVKLSAEVADTEIPFAAYYYAAAAATFTAVALP